MTHLNGARSSVTQYRVTVWPATVLHGDSSAVSLPDLLVLADYGEVRFIINHGSWHNAVIKLTEVPQVDRNMPVRRIVIATRRNHPPIHKAERGRIPRSFRGLFPVCNCLLDISLFACRNIVMWNIDPHMAVFCNI